MTAGKRCAHGRALEAAEDEHAGENHAFRRPHGLAGGVNSAKISCGNFRQLTTATEATVPQVRDDLASRVVSWRACDPTARMRSGTTHIQARNRAAIVAVPQHGPRAEQLIELQRAVEDVSADES